MKVKLDDDVREILQRSTVDGDTLTLPPKQLEPKTYQRVKKAIALLGGKWNTPKQRFIFEHDPRELLAEGLESGAARHLKNEYQFFETPTEIAERLVEIANGSGHHHYLEPSAGRGAIVQAIQSAHPDAPITAVEVDPRHEMRLRSLIACVFVGDFLTRGLPKGYDRIIANPPFSSGQDIDHVTRMYDLLSPGGVLVSVMCGNVAERKDKRGRTFAKLIEQHGEVVETLPEGAFAESGTSINTVIVRMRKVA